jgi:hypothetical protein
LAGMIASKFILDPLRGVTKLWKVAWFYSLVGGAVLQIVSLLFVKAGGSVVVVSLVCLAYVTYVTFGFYRCAGNCPWPTIGRLVRFCSLTSLIAVLFLAYLILADGLSLTT